MSNFILNLKNCLCSPPVKIKEPAIQSLRQFSLGKFRDIDRYWLFRLGKKLDFLWNNFHSTRRLLALNCLSPNRNHTLPRRSHVFENSFFFCCNNLDNSSCISNKHKSNFSQIPCLMNPSFYKNLFLLSGFKNLFYVFSFCHVITIWAIEPWFYFPYYS